MRRNIKVLAGAAVISLAAAGGAFAFWTASASGSGTATTGDTVGLKVVQTATTELLVPGGSVPLHGTIDNPNTTAISTLGANFGATISGVTQTPAGLLVGDCTTADYTITASQPNGFTITVVGGNGDIEPGTAAATWEGYDLNMVNAEWNQDGCKGATVNISYAP